MNYLNEFSDDCLNDLSISVGYIGDDIVALCHDSEASYALHATLHSDRYIIRMSSTHGVISTLEFSGNIGARQLVLRSMSEHLDNVRDAENGRYTELPSSLN